MQRPEEHAGGVDSQDRAIALNEQHDWNVRVAAGGCDVHNIPVGANAQTLRIDDYLYRRGSVWSGLSGSRLQSDPGAATGYRCAKAERSRTVVADPQVLCRNSRGPKASGKPQESRYNGQLGRCSSAHGQGHRDVRRDARGIQHADLAVIDAGGHCALIHGHQQTGRRVSGTRRHAEPTGNNRRGDLLSGVHQDLICGRQRRFVARNHGKRLAEGGAAARWGREAQTGRVYQQYGIAKRCLERQKSTLAAHAIEDTHIELDGAGIGRRSAQDPRRAQAEPGWVGVHRKHIRRGSTSCADDDRIGSADAAAR